jgi:hypothetical protein
MSQPFEAAAAQYQCERSRITHGLPGKRIEG